MSFTSLMMYISPVLLLVLYVYTGFSEAAPRISAYDASLISRKPDSASDTWEIFHTDTPRSLRESSLSVGPLTGLTPSPDIVPAGPSTTSGPTAKTATTFQPPTTGLTAGAAIAPDTRINSAEKEQASRGGGGGAQKRSTDAQTSLFAPEKMLQSMVSMVSQRSANDAWAADNIGPSVTSAENIQGGSHWNGMGPASLFFFSLCKRCFAGESRCFCSCSGKERVKEAARRTGRLF